MDQNRIVMADFMLELTNGLQERLALDIAYGCLLYTSVRDEMQSQGIGKLLLNFVKEKKTQLCLNV